jgi:cytochrome c5
MPVRLLLPLSALSLAACNLDRDAAKEHVTREDEQQIRRTDMSGGFSAEPAASGAEKVAVSKEEPVNSMAEEGTQKVGHAYPQRAEAHSSTMAHPPYVVAAPPAPARASFQEGRELVQVKCTTCHTLEVALVPQRSAAGWAEMVELMVGHGMVASDAERRSMQDYLAVCCLRRPAP